jgi:hypothetical protein
MSDEEAYRQSVECITGPVSKTISTKVIPGMTVTSKMSPRPSQLR